MNDLTTRRLSLAPSTFDKAAGTVQATISTGASVQRSAYVERLAVTPEAVEISQNIPILDAHRQGSIADVLGRVLGVSFTNGTMAATLRISSPAALDAIERGDVTGCSIGYRVAAWSDVRADGVLTRTATKWSLLEVSLVPLPADAGAILRSNPTMTETATVEMTAEQTAATARADLNRSIRSVATATSLGTTWADQQIDAGATIEQVRAAALDELIKRGGTPISTQRVEAGFSHDAPAVTVQRMSEALTARIMPATAPSEAARPYMGLSLVDMARTLLQLRGEHGVAMMGREAIIQRALVPHATYDFNDLLNSTGNRVLMGAYEAMPNPLKLLARKGTIDDFRKKTLLRISDPGPLQRVLEGGEIQSTTRADSSEAYQLETYASIFALTRRALINDDLGAFADFAASAGRAASETEAGLLVNLLTQGSGVGPIMFSDGNAMFSTVHGNIAATGGAITTDTLGAARKAMRLQVGRDGKTPINAAPKYLVVGADRETEAEKVLATIAAGNSDDVNVFQGKLTLLVEARLPATAWYLFADPAVLPCLEYSYLAAAQGPQISQRDGWEILGTEFRVVLDFGCGALDWRGAYRNAGA